MRTSIGLRGWLAATLASFMPLAATAADHHDPAPDAVWPTEAALHKDWDLGDLFAWVDHDTDKLNIIVAWHPLQLPLDVGQRAQYNDQILYKVFVRYERAGVQVSDRYIEREINVRYGQNDEGAWGMLVQGLPATGPLVLDCDSDQGWRDHTLEVGSGAPSQDTDTAFQIATGMWDDPFVFDLDGYNASLTRALEGEVGLQFDPLNDTFAGHNVSAFVLSIPIGALEDHWDDFDRSGLLETNNVHVWATSSITGSEAEREDAGS